MRDQVAARDAKHRGHHWKRGVIQTGRSPLRHAPLRPQRFEQTKRWPRIRPDLDDLFGEISKGQAERGQVLYTGATRVERSGCGFQFPRRAGL